MATIKKDTLHPEGEPEVDIYPKTSIDQVENLQVNLDALNGDISNANGEISSISNRVNIAEKNITDLQNDVNQNIMDISTAESNIQGLQGSVSSIAERVDTAETGLVQLTEQIERVGNETNQNTSDITKLNTAYNSYTDYSTVTNGFLLTYVSGRQIELPIKAGTNVTFSKYPGTNQIIINATGGSVPDNIAILNANNTFTGSNTFNNNIQVSTTITLRALNDNIIFSTQGITKNNYSFMYPNQSGTIALTTDIPTLADYPTTIFFNNYNAGIGYKDTSTGTIKTVVSTDNNGAQIVLGESNTGLTLATNARPKVLEDSTVKEVAYVSDIPNTSSFATLAGNNTWTGQNVFDNGITMGTTEYTPEGPHVYYGDYRADYGERWISTQYQDKSGVINLPQGKSGTMALVEDIPSISSFATLTGNNNFTGSNTFEADISIIPQEGNFCQIGYNNIYWSDTNVLAGFTWDSIEFHLIMNEHDLLFPKKSGTLATLDDISSGSSQVFSSYSDYTLQNSVLMLTYKDGSKFELPIKAGTNVTFSKYPGSNYVVINAATPSFPISVMYSSSKLGESSVDFPFNINKNYFFTITMTNTGDSKSFIYAKGRPSATYTIVINSSTSFEVKLDVTGSSTRLIFTNKSNADPFVVRAEISN